MDVVEVLRLGREHVASHWTQGLLVDGAGRTCAMGAVTAAAAGFPPELPVPRSGEMFMGAPRPVVEALVAALPRGVRRYRDKPGASLIAYNDAHGRRQSAILRLFDRAIAAQS